MCSNDPTAPDFNSCQYWLTSGRSVAEVSTVVTPSSDAKAIHAMGRFEDVTAVRSDDTASPPTTYEVEVFAVSHLVEQGDGSTLGTMRIRGTIVDTTTGAVVDLIDNATIDPNQGSPARRSPTAHGRPSGLIRGRTDRAYMQHERDGHALHAADIR